MQNQVIVLKKKIKSLQQQLCQRTRNYLYHFKKSPIKQKSSSYQQISIQTQQITQYTQVTQTTTISPCKLLQPFKQSLENGKKSKLILQDTPKRERKNNLITLNSRQYNVDITGMDSSLKSSQKQAKQQFFDYQLIQRNNRHMNQIDTLTHQIRDIKGKLQRVSKSQHKGKLNFNSPPKLAKKQSAQNKLKDSLTRSRLNQSIEQNQHLNQQIVILRDQIIRLKGRLQYEINFSTLTKQALLRSEQQNYNFRLNMQDMRKQMSLVNSAFKSTQQRQQDQQQNQTRALFDAIHINDQIIQQSLSDSNRISDIVPVSKQNNSNIIQQMSQHLQQSLAFPKFNYVNSQQKIPSTEEQSKQELIQKFKSENIQYQEMINHLEQVKNDYLNKYIKSKQNINLIKQQNVKLKTEVKDLRIALIKQFQKSQGHRSRLQQSFDQTTSQRGMLTRKNYHSLSHQTLFPQPTKANQLQSKVFTNSNLFGQPLKNFQPSKWLELFKSKVHEISNCLPLQTQTDEVLIFRPQSIDQLITMLERILEFCTNIGHWEREKIMAVQQERANLLRILSAVLANFPSTKNVIAEQISQIQELKYLVNFLNKDRINAERINANTNSDKKNYTNSILNQADQYLAKNDKQRVY